MMIRKVVSGVTILGLLGTYTPVLADNEFDLVNIVETVVSQCGQQVPFSGIADVADGQELVVQFDGVNIPFTFEPDSILWTTSFVSVGAGNHTVTATIMEGSTVVASDTLLVNSVPACQSQNSDNGSGGNSGGGGGGGGGDEEVAPQSKKGKVKAAVAIRGAIVNKAVPGVVARIFGEVYGHAIKPMESTYWKKRARTDKRTEAALKGTMQFYKVKGLTKGK